MKKPYRVWTVSFHQLIDGDVILMQLGPCVVPANYSFSSCREKGFTDRIRSTGLKMLLHTVPRKVDLTIYFFEHAIHMLQIVVVQKPDRVVFIIFIKWN